jgi:VIT1/CCC1 family predicted Fe2+/Mn2+ transporter
MGLTELMLGNTEHVGQRAGWLRAAVLGVNDGLVSTASLMVGVAAASTDLGAVVTAGIAAVAAGAMSMAAGEYVSVKSQADIEATDRELERRQHERNPQGELEELTLIYVERGLTHELATEVAKSLHSKDALTAHYRDELGHHVFSRPQPVQAAVASALAFTAGGMIPFLAGFFPAENRILGVFIVTEIGLVVAGLLSARAASAKPLIPTIRVVIGGTLAMAVTFAVGTAFGTFAH